MRLTKANREAFVIDAMNDVPQIDYNQQIQDLIQNHLLSIAPPAILKAYKDPKTKGYFKSVRVNAPRYTSYYVYLVPDDYKHTPELQTQLQGLSDLNEKQRDSMITLKNKLKGAISAFSTREAAAKAMPEFEKYLPSADVVKTKNLPAISNLVADLVAAGWPKQKAEAEAKKRGKK